MSTTSWWGSAPDEELLADEELVRRVQQGESRLFGLVFDRYYGRVERFVRHLGVSESDLEDVLAETFARAFSRIQSFNPDSGTRYISYVYAIARNLATDRLRERGRMPELVLLEDAWGEADPHAETPVEAVVLQEEVARIRRALKGLSPSDREIITLSYDQELSCREIMEVMGKPSVSAVTTHLSKAMKRLRRLVTAAEPATPAL